MKNMASSLIIVYLIISFGFSVVEKITSWNKSKAYYREHFKGTWIEDHIPLSLLLVILLETISIGLCIRGLYGLLHSGAVYWASAGLVFVSLTLMMLMAGQRIAQDYSGAMNITVYFVLSAMGLYFLETL